jgi:seryl-tRNA synthetase
MLDLKAFEREPELFAEKLQRRGEVQGLSELLSQLKQRKELIGELQVDQAKKNAVSKELGTTHKDQIESRRAELKDLSSRIKEREHTLKELEAIIENAALRIPNITRDDVPVGADESGNVVIKHVLEPRHFDFKVRDHVEIGEFTGTIDLARAAKVSGSRFAFLRGVGSQLNRALLQYMTDYHVELGDTELTPPYLVKEEAQIGAGNLPKFKDDLFEVPWVNDTSLYLIPTAEVPVTNYLADEIVDEENLPMRFCAYSACFRSEAGAAGKDTRGIIRLHQFEKVEMVRFCTPEQAEAELDDLVARASNMLVELKLPHRIVLKCTGDTSFHAEKTYDLEVWVPSQGCYREISSCSAFGSFQARRAKIRYRKLAQPGSQTRPKPEPLATLNGSGLPLGRTIVAILENHQRADGSVEIPEVLRPLMRDRAIIPVSI